MSRDNSHCSNFAGAAARAPQPPALPTPAKERVPPLLDPLPQGRGRPHPERSPQREAPFAFTGSMRTPKGSGGPATPHKLLPMFPV